MFKKFEQQNDEIKALQEQLAHKDKRIKDLMERVTEQNNYLEHQSKKIRTTSKSFKAWKRKAKANEEQIKTLETQLDQSRRDLLDKKTEWISDGKRLKVELLQLDSEKKAYLRRLETRDKEINDLQSARRRYLTSQKEAKAAILTLVEDWGQPEAARSPSVESLGGGGGPSARLPSLEGNPRDESLYPRLTGILNAMRAHPYAKHFLAPSGTAVESIWDEFHPNDDTVVDTPMNLDTMKSKLEANEYHTLHDFTNDAQLIFEKYSLLSPEDSRFAEYAKKLEKFMWEMINNDQSSAPSLKRKAINRTPSPSPFDWTAVRHVWL